MSIKEWIFTLLVTLDQAAPGREGRTGEADFGAKRQRNTFHHRGPPAWVRTVSCRCSFDFSCVRVTTEKCRQVVFQASQHPYKLPGHLGLDLEYLFLVSPTSSSVALLKSLFIYLKSKIRKERENIFPVLAHFPNACNSQG